MKPLYNRAIRVLLVTNALILLAAGMLGPIYAIYVEEIGGDLLDASFAFAIFAFVAACTTFVSGRYSDLIKENELIVVVGYIIMGLGFLAYMLVSSVWSLFVVQIFIGLGEAIYSPAFDAVFSKHLDGHKSGQEWGAWEAMNYFTTAIGAVAGGLLVAYFGFQAMFLMMSTLCIFSALYIYRLPRSLL